MGTKNRRCLVLALMLVGLSSVVALGAPGFSDRNIAAGNLNSTDTILVQEIRVTRNASDDVTLSSIQVQNLGTAGDGEIDKIIVRDGGDILGETTNIAGLDTGVTINLGGFHMTSTTHYLKIYVVAGTAIEGGETINLRCKVHYVDDGSSGTSAWISDLTGEILQYGGFDEIEDGSPDAGYLNPVDEHVVQQTTFTDNDANGSGVFWTQTGSKTVVQVENLGTADPSDINDVCVSIAIAGVEYTTGWVNWNPASPMDFAYNDFVEDSNPENLVQDPGGDPLPASVADNAAMTVVVRMRMGIAADVVDRRTIRTKTTVYVTETGEGDDGEAVDYVQESDSVTTQTIRKQGFEEITEESQKVASGTAATGDLVIQTIRLRDEDSNGNDVTITRIYLRNSGSADGDELEKIEVKAGAQTLLTLTGNELDDFKTGDWFVVDTEKVVKDDEEQVVKIYYTIGTPIDGHTLRPAVRFTGEEPDPGTAYNSDEMTYPDTLGLYEPGFEFIENVTPPEGGVAYSGQRLLAQRIRCEDLDEDDENVTIDPVVVKNIGSAQENPDITKIEVWRQDTEGGEELKLGEETDLSGLRTSGVTIDMVQDNIVSDSPSGAETFLNIYLTIAEPEDMTAGRTIQLVTRVLHTENQASFDKDVTSNQWTLETNHRPVPDFTFAVATAAAAAGATPKADFTYDQTIQFTGTATDQDGDAIASWHWNFGDGNTSNGQNPTHQYPNGGTFTVTLTVTDDRGVTGSVSKTITVEGPPNVVPTIDAVDADPQNPAQDQDVAFSVEVTDPDQPAGTPFTYEWDFDDGTTSASATPTHAFQDKGAYTVTVKVTDAQGASDTQTVEVSVGNDPPTLTGVTSSANPETGADVTFTAQGADDPDDDAITEYRWDFDDGSAEHETTGPTATHVYAAPGTYTVSVRAVDARGGISEPKTVQITVAGPTKVIVYGYPNPADTQATIAYYLPEGATDPVLHVYNLKGGLVLEQELGAGQSEYVWNLQDTRDEDVPNGLYLAVVTAKDDDGKAIKSEIFKLLVVR